MAATLSFIDGSGSATSGAASDFGGGVSLAYNSSTGAYTVTDANGASAAFLPSARDPVESDGTVSVYERTSGNRTDQLALFNPGASNAQLVLSYVSYGAWTRFTDNGSSVDLASQFFVYGIRQAADRPSTGSASYSTIVDGVWANPDGVYVLGGASSFTADFSAMTVATTLDLTGARVGGGSKALGRFNGAGSIAALGGGFNGTLTHAGTDGDGNVYNGSFAGAFFGPQGQEVGYSFSLTGPGGAAAGAVVGKSN